MTGKLVLSRISFPNGRYSSLRKMAEVSRRLGFVGSGVCRLSALINVPICRVPFSENYGEAATAKVVWKRIWTSCCKLESTHLKEDILVCMTSGYTAPALSMLRKRGTTMTTCYSQSFKSSNILLSQGVLEKEVVHPQVAFYPLPAGTPFPLHVTFLGDRMRCWSNRYIVMATTSHTTYFGSLQPRAYSTTMISTERSEEGMLKCRWSTFSYQVLQPSTSTARSYTTSDTPPIYRSKTAYYDILHVTPHATQTQIKTAYYKQSFIHHPDKNPDNKEAAQHFADISTAYSILGSIGLRKKYDCGILSESDVRGAGRPSVRDTASSKCYGPRQQQSPRSKRYTHSGGKTATFDFDAFFQAHYGEQLRREREIKARKVRLQDKQQEDFKKWKEGKMMEVTVAVLLATAGMILLSFISL